MSTLLEVLGLVTSVLLPMAAVRWQQYQRVARRRQIERRTAEAISQVQARYQAAMDMAVYQAMLRAMQSSAPQQPYGHKPYGETVMGASYHLSWPKKPDGNGQP
jgi:hypothetical protein